MCGSRYFNPTRTVIRTVFLLDKKMINKINSKKIFQYLLPLLISGLILLIIFSKINLKEVRDIYLQADKILLLIAFFIFFSTNFVLTWRWQILLKLLDYELPYQKLLGVFLASLPIAKTTPANSGDLVRPFLINKQIPASRNIGIIIIEALFDFTVLAVLAISAAFLTNYRPALIIGSLILLSVLIIFLILAKIKIKGDTKLKQQLANLIEIFSRLKNNPKIIGQILLITFFSWLIVCLFIKILFVAFNVDLNFGTILSIQPIIILLSLMPITIAGIGLRETGMLFFYFGYASESVLITAGITHSLYTAVIMPLLGLPFLFKLIKSRANK